MMFKFYITETTAHKCITPIAWRQTVIQYTDMKITPAGMPEFLKG